MRRRHDNDLWERAARPGAGVGSHDDPDRSPGYADAVRRTTTCLPAVALLTAALTACTPSTAPATTAPSPTAPSLPAPTEVLLADEIAENTAVGTLAPGFPSALVAVPPDSEVLVSSAEPLPDGRLRISLNVRTAQDAVGLLDTVRGPLLAAGFAEFAPDAPEPGLAAQTTFLRGDGAEHLVVGVLDRADVRTMTLGGTVVAPSP